ncbi:MAG: hypothetical protein OEM63_02290 [Gammaproteobacteria bacterium]|nr:hypothetical protein [Gammaproteobacteria bacterium]
MRRIVAGRCRDKTNREVDDMATRASEVTSVHVWQNSPFGGGTESWRGALQRHRSKLGFGLAAVLVVVGWLIRDLGLLTAEKGFGYFLGIASVCCMLVLLLYPLRKRVRKLKFLGPLPRWFRNHMIFGVSAPIIALYHCNFSLGSLNSRIALFSALAVAGSGLIGRFIYSKIHHGLYGRKANLKDLLAKIQVPAPGAVKFGSLIPELSTRLTQYDHDVLAPPKNLFRCFLLPVVMWFRTVLQNRRLNRFVRASLMVQAQNSPEIARHRVQFEKLFRDHIANHLAQVRKVAEFTAYERLFALWRKVHLPFFVLLLVTVVVHVAVVHLY